MEPVNPQFDFQQLKDKVAQLPLAPGVYLYKDSAGKVIYVGSSNFAGWHIAQF